MTEERVGDADGCGDCADWVGDGLTLTVDGEGVGVPSDTVTEHADNRRRAGTHTLIAELNAKYFAPLREAAILTRRG
jgi:hypothetical protein